MKAEIEQIYKQLKNTDFNQYHQKIGAELKKEKPFTVEMPKGSNIYYCHTWEHEPETIEKAKSDYRKILEVRFSMYNLKKPAYLKLFEMPGNLDYQIETQLDMISDIIQRVYMKPFASVQMGYFLSPEQYVTLGEIWAYCDLFIEFYEMLQSYQAGNYQTGFTTKPELNLQKIFAELSAAGYIESDFSGFLAVFSPLPVLFHRVRWIKQNQRGKNTAKKALIDMLRLMGVPDDQITDKKRLEACFADADGQPLIFTGSNFYNNNDYRHHSEYYPELQKIIG